MVDSLGEAILGFEISKSKSARRLAGRCAGSNADDCCHGNFALLSVEFGYQGYNVYDFTLGC